MSDNINNDVSQHGGNLSEIARLFPNAPQPFIDLSTGINPYSYPLPEIKKEWFSRLADSCEMEDAHKATAVYYGTNAENISLAAGMQPLSFALASLRLQAYGVAKVAISSPTYSEYEQVWKIAGHNTNNQPSTTSNIHIICNPNNPDGRTIPRAELLQLADDLAKTGGWLIVDEAFGDVCPENSVASEVAARDNLFVMKSCGKFFGVAGLRVSAVIAPANWNEKIRVITGSWAISTPACLLLPEMFENKTWAEEMKLRLEFEAQNWREILAQYFSIVGFTPLFTLVKTDDADYWYKKLASQGILTRKFSYNKQWLRLGLPDSKDIERVITAFV